MHILKPILVLFSLCTMIFIFSSKINWKHEKKDEKREVGGERLFLNKPPVGSEAPQENITKKKDVSDRR